MRMALTSRTLPLLAGAVVLAGIIPSVVMLVLARGLHIAKVDDRPYVVSSTIDADRRAVAGLRARGFSYATAVSGDEIILTLRGPAPEQVAVVLQRPDDVKADQRYPWVKTAEPLHLRPGRLGPWHVRLEGRVDGVAVRLGETAVDLGK
jgi:FixH